MGSGQYILDGKTPVLCDDLIKWGKWIGGADRKVKLTETGESRISTVFLGLDHSFNDGPPILFETMVFGGAMDGEMDRYSTWEDAEAGHENMVVLVKAKQRSSRKAKSNER